jgi:hypothetical protein
MPLESSDFSPLEGGVDAEATVGNGRKGRPFGAVIGATGPQIDRRRAAGFFAALAMGMSPVMLRHGAGMPSFIHIAIVTAAAVIGFRLVRDGLAAATAAAALYAGATTLLTWLRVNELPVWDFVMEFGVEWAFFAVLALATPRVTPLLLALFAGSMAPKVVHWLITAFRSDWSLDWESVGLGILGAALFAAVMGVAVWVTNDSASDEPTAPN